MAAPYVDHVAIRTRNFERDLDFFQTVLDMQITLTDPEDVDVNDVASMKQAWAGGIHLQRDDSYDPAKQADGQLTHIGISISGVDAVLEKVYAREGVVQAEGKPRNWFVLPEGPMIELVEAE